MERVATTHCRRKNKAKNFLLFYSEAGLEIATGQDNNKTK